MASAPPPGVREKVKPVEAQLGRHGRQLLHEEIDGPHRGVVGPLGVPTPQLVIEHNTPTRRRRCRNWLQILVGQARPAVDDDDGRPSGGVTDDPALHPVAPDDHRTLLGIAHLGHRTSCQQALLARPSMATTTPS